MNLLRYWNTVKYLKPVQTFGRVYFMLRKPKIKLSGILSLRMVSQQWMKAPLRQPAIENENSANFLNETHEISSPDIWNKANIEPLWLYNLHYFDDLNSQGRAEKIIFHQGLMQRWVEENPIGTGKGWKPYPLALRIVNWVKYGLGGYSLNSFLVESLCIQARYQYERIEYHLQGNHLLASAKALVMAGLYFDGEEADKWVSKGLDIYEKQIPLQILEDGGHFELSPMYHGIILEDLLDVINIVRSYFKHSQSFNNRTKNISHCIVPMLSWLKSMCHPDGQIALFNDAALNVSLSPEMLISYASALGFDSPISHEKITDLRHSGYYKIHSENVTAIIDAAPIGPDYLTAHSHADSLSFELSIENRRIIVNTGTSCYGFSEDRLFERGTGAHNCLVLENSNSSETWSSFRVGKRARITHRKAEQSEHSIQISASHNGYQTLNSWGIHHRKWIFKNTSLEVIDHIDCKKKVSGKIIYHFHPMVQVKPGADTNSFDLLLDNKTVIGRLNTDKKLSVQLKKSYYSPEFGKKVSNISIEMVGSISNSDSIKTEFIWT